MGRLIISFIVVFFSMYSNANNMLGIMECKVTENQLITVADGRPNLYTGYDSGIKKLIRSI